MKRREFLAGSAAAAAALVSAPMLRAADAPASARQLLELRIYHFPSAAKQQAFDQFLADAAVPALNRAGVEPVGVFKLMAKDNAPLKLEADSTDLYILLPHKSAESLATLENRLAADETFLKAGESVINAPKSSPAYSRYESSLLLAFEGFPTVQVPTKAATRLMQLRIYEAHSKERNRKKVSMFNEGGEIAIFKRSGMNAVFFGEAIAGSKLPNLTYMLAFEDEQAQKKGWGAFGKDPEWQKISKDPAYNDTVSNITNLVLRPAASSQI